MQRDQYKRAILRSLSLQVIALSKEIEEFGYVNSFKYEDKMFEMLIQKIGTVETFRLVEMIAAKAATDAETYLGPDIFAENKPVPFSAAEKNDFEDTEWGGAYYFQRERIFPIEFQGALIVMADHLRSAKLPQDKPMKRIELQFTKREKLADPDRLEMRFFTDKKETPA